MRSVTAGTMLMVGLLAMFLWPVYAQEQVSNPPASLLVFPKSENIRYDQKDGAWWAYYDAQVPYPAEEVLQFIRGGLERQGWQPLKEDILNPGEPSSHVTGWRDFVDGRTSPKTQVHQWLAQWKNSQGDVVWYGLRYKHPIGTAIPKTLSVVATFYPANIVEQQLKWADEERKKKGKQK